MHIREREREKNGQPASYYTYFQQSCRACKQGPGVVEELCFAVLVTRDMLCNKPLISEGRVERREV